MPIYIFAGPAVALIGIISVFFVLRHKSVEKRSMYSSRRSQIERKVKAARSRTLAPRGRGDKAPTEAEIAAAAPPMSSAPAYEAPRQPSWDVGPTPAATPAYTPPPAYEAPAYEPPSAPPSSAPAEPSTPVPAEAEWTPAPAEQVWTPAPSADIPRAREAEPALARAEVPSGGGAAWSVVGDARPAEEAPAKDKGKRKDKAASGSPWELSSGGAPGEEADEDVKQPSAAMAIAQYAVLVVGLVMVLIGVLVMVANTKVT
jgi:hypothetical protein